MGLMVLFYEDLRVEIWVLKCSYLLKCSFMGFIGVGI